ncbi:hypothetical protein Pyrfu_1619 [Pyrolobus fumarii 1A]|uniref:Uncharacterized protein n=1 Tax=Pyrolobus fumarii (strain DSM 11204 / 1A) TaxID=694429 RepID=G0ECA6_PYRF1|nr:hypothetical protein Pyrfu_1619 [Pyrolobus fumarii 1A]
MLAREGKRVVLVGGRVGRVFSNNGELVILPLGELKRRLLINFLVSVSSGVDRIVVDCESLSYTPVGEAILVYKWLVDSLEVHVVGECVDESLANLGLKPLDRLPC